jgi:hypothetical protein
LSAAVSPGSLAENLAEALSGLAVDVQSGTRVFTARLRSPRDVAAEVLRRLGDRPVTLPDMTPAQAAAALGIGVRALTRRANAGLVPCTRTEGGNRRYPERVIRELARRERGGG